MLGVLQLRSQSISYATSFSSCVGTLSAVLVFKTAVLAVVHLSLVHRAVLKARETIGRLIGSQAGAQTLHPCTSPQTQEPKRTREKSCEVKCFAESVARVSVTLCRMRRSFKSHALFPNNSHPLFPNNSTKLVSILF